FTLGAGIRYFHDDQTFTSDAIQHGTFSATSPRVYARFKVTPDITTYTSVAKGFRSGGFNTLDQPSYGPEVVWTYELGTKATLFDRRLSSDIAIFYSDYSEYQGVGSPPPPAP